MTNATKLICAAKTLNKPYTKVYSLLVVKEVTVLILETEKETLNYNKLLVSRNVFSLLLVVATSIAVNTFE